MILCVNPNAAVDKTVTIDRFQVNAIYRPSFELALPGGKGCNVARVAKTLGQEAVVAGWVGGTGGRFIEQGLRAEGIKSALVKTKAESRACLSILDPVLGTLTEIYEKGRPVTGDELESFFALFKKWLPRAEMVTLSGSLPPGVPNDFYTRLIRLARESGVPCALDSSGEALRLGWEEGRPFLLKCNRAELGELSNEPLSDLSSLERETRKLASRWGSAVVVTLGAAGAVGSEQHKSGRVRTWLAQPPRLEAASAVGSGDAFLAGMVTALAQNRSFDEALRLATAAGAANTLLLGAGRLRREDVDALYAQVRVAEVE